MKRNIRVTLLNAGVSVSIAVTFFLTGFACKENPPGPPDNTPKPGKRDYVWTVDTLAYPGSFQTLMRDIWASSAKDVYVVGHNDQNRGKMYHYDGSDWKLVRLSTSEGGNILGPIDLVAVHGFDSNNVWAVGEKIYTNPNPPPDFLDSSLIIHYDGTGWREVPIERGSFLTTIWGANPNNIWAAGIYGSLYHYDGVTWEKISFDTTINFGAMFGFSSSDIYVPCGRKIDTVSPDDTSQYLLYHYDGQKWMPIDSFLAYPGYGSAKFGYSKLWGTSDVSMYSVGQMIFQKNGSAWKIILATTLAFYDIFGSSDLNVFAVGMYNQIFHFNGEDWYRFDQFIDLNKYCEGVWCDGNEVFLISSDSRRTYVLHGK